MVPVNNWLAVVFSKHLNKWWCCNSKMSSSRYVSSNSMPDSWAANRASAAFFLLTNAAPLEAFAIRIRASRAFYNIYGHISYTWAHFNPLRFQVQMQYRKWNTYARTRGLGVLCWHMLKFNTYSLCFAFIGALILMINSTKVGNDYRYRQCDYKHTTQWTNATHNFSSYRLRHHVTIAAECGWKTNEALLYTTIHLDYHISDAVVITIVDAHYDDLMVAVLLTLPNV